MHIGHNNMSDSAGGALNVSAQVEAAGVPIPSSTFRPGPPDGYVPKLIPANDRRIV